MIEIQRFVCNMIQENCYVVSDETKEAVIIDCGAYFESERSAISDYIKEKGLHPVHLLATHGHMDHNFGNKFIDDQWGLKAEVHASDEELMKQLHQQTKDVLHIEMQPENFPAVGKLLHGNDTISFGSHHFTIIETPGHTPGGVFYYCEQEHVAFSGDTLFRGNIGRADLPGGSMFLLIQSLRAVSQLPDNTDVYPGHGDATTIGREVASNPYLDR